MMRIVFLPLFVFLFCASLLFLAFSVMPNMVHKPPMLTTFSVEKSSTQLFDDANLILDPNGKAAHISSRECIILLSVALVVFPTTLFCPCIGQQIDRSASYNSALCFLWHFHQKHANEILS